MKEPTKADLATAVAKLTEENAGLRDLLAAVSECARAVPQAAAYGDRRQLSRATSVLIRISVVTDPGSTWVWSWGSGEGAAHLRELAAEPVDYEVYVKPEAGELHAEPDSRRYCESTAEHSGRRCTEQGPHVKHRNGMVVWGPGVTEPASPDAAEALIDAIVAGTPVKSLAGNQNMTNKECIARVAHGGRS